MSYEHKTVNLSVGEYARFDAGDGFHEVHVNTAEGLWLLLRSWLRPLRGISQDKRPRLFRAGLDFSILPFIDYFQRFSNGTR